jgi:hypothetical protein
MRTMLDRERERERERVVVGPEKDRDVRLEGIKKMDSERLDKV